MAKSRNEDSNTSADTVMPGHSITEVPLKPDNAVKMSVVKPGLRAGSLLSAICRGKAAENPDVRFSDCEDNAESGGLVARLHEYRRALRIFQMRCRMIV
jgi:hypothetical protein